MYNELVVKEVNFCGDNLLAVKEKDSEKIYVGISYICKGLGLSRKKADYEISRIQSDIVLKKGSLKIGVASNGGVQDSICIEIDYLPLWLAKINPNIILDKGIQDKLIQYQLKAKDVLANAFIENIKYNIPQTFSEALLLAGNLQKQLDEQKPKIEIYDDIVASENLLNFKQISNSFGIGRNSMLKLLRSEKILSDNESNWNLPYERYSSYFKVKVFPKRTSNGVKTICTTLCTTQAVPLIKKVLDKRKDLLRQAN